MSFMILKNHSKAKVESNTMSEKASTDQNCWDMPSTNSRKSETEIKD